MTFPPLYLPWPQNVNGQKSYKDHEPLSMPYQPFICRCHSNTSFMKFITQFSEQLSAFLSYRLASELHLAHRKCLQIALALQQCSVFGRCVSPPKRIELQLASICIHSEGICGCVAIISVDRSGAIMDCSAFIHTCRGAPSMASRLSQSKNT